MKRAAFFMAVLILVLGFCGCSGDSSSESAPVSTGDEAPKAATKDEADNTETEVHTTEPETIPAEYYNRLDSILSSPLKRSSHQLEVEEWIQYPELPTGCESVALTAALDYLGFDIEKTEIAENYLYYEDYDLMYGYVGDPFSDFGAAIYPPGLTATANSYLSHMGSDYHAINTMGTELSDLYKLIDNGYPVVIWSTLYQNEPSMTDDEYYYDGETYYWYDNEHCEMLCGYDLEDNTVTISDPNEGVITCDADSFEEIYNEVGKLSMTIINLDGTAR